METILDTVLSPDQVTVNLQGTGKREIISNLLDLLCTTGKVSDRPQALQDLLDHEALMSTGMEDGIAIPHAKSDTVEELIAAVGISKKKINFESLDGKPAQIFIMTLSPKGAGGPHVQFLSDIAKLLKDKKKRKKMVAAKTDQALLEILRG